MIKANILDQFLVDWFVKSLLPYIAKDIALSGVMKEQEVIIRAQQLDLVYSQSRVLYDILPNSPRAETKPTKFSHGPHADGIVGSVQNVAMQQNLNHPQIQHQTNPYFQNLNTSPEILSLQKGPQTSEGKKKMKNKKKNEANSGNNNVKNNNNNQNQKNVGKDKKKKGKAKQPCKFCGESHFLSECRQLVEAKKLYDHRRSGIQPTMLTNPFPTNQQIIVGTQNPGPRQGGNQGNPSQGVDPSVADIFMCQVEVELQTRVKKYDITIVWNHDKEASTSQSNPMQIE